MSECNHDELFDWDCSIKCPECGEFGPHIYIGEPRCDICGQPHEQYDSALRSLIG